MEALVEALGEFISVPNLIFYVLITEFGASFVLFVANRLWNRAAGTRPPDTVEKPEVHRPVRRKWLRTLSMCILGLVAFTVLGLVMAHSFFFEPTLRWVLHRVEDRTGIAITFDAAEGSFFTGRVQLSGAGIKRDQSETSEFDLRADELLVDIDWWGSVDTIKALEEVTIKGLRGTFARVGVPDRVRVKKPFSISVLNVRDSEIVVSDYTRSADPVVIKLTVDSLKAEPLRSRWIVFDVFLGATCHGLLDGYPFSIETADVAGKNETRWLAESLPLDKVGAYIGGPLNWMQDGQLAVDVIHTWKRGSGIEIKMHYDLMLRGVRAVVPDDLSRPAKVVAIPIVAYLNKRGEELPLRFDLVINKDGFEGTYSIEAAGLWRALSGGITTALADATGVDPAVIKEHARSAFGKVKGFLDKHRKKKKKEEEENP